MMRKLESIAVFTLCLAVFCSADPALAQTDSSDDDERWLLAPYVWLAGMEGEVGVRGVIAPVDASFGDILDNTEMGALVHFEGQFGKWGFLVDPVYLSLSSEKTFTAGPLSTSVKADVDYLLLDVAAIYSARPVELIFGLRYNSYDTDLAIGALTTVDGSKSWVDAIVGLRVISPVTETLGISLQAEIGGLGADFTWGASSFLVYKPWERTSLAFGYRVLETDFRDGSGASEFLYDVKQGGPAFGVLFEF